MNHHHSVEIWVFAGEPPCQVLLLEKMAVEGKHPAYWQPITGGILYQESPIQAAQREFFEETGFKKSDWYDLQTTISLAIKPKVCLVRHLFVVRTDQAIPQLDTNEHINAQWVHSDQVLDFISQDSSRLGWLEVNRAWLHSRK